MPKQSILCEKIFSQNLMQISALLQVKAENGKTSCFIILPISVHMWHLIFFWHARYFRGHWHRRTLVSIHSILHLPVYSKNHITLSRWHFSHNSKTPDIFIVHWHCITLEIIQSTFLEQNMSPKFFCFISFPFSHQSRRNNIIPLCPNFLLPTTVFQPSPVW